jgi:Fungalysin/Thermolysin Propeptide Motif
LWRITAVATSSHGWDGGAYEDKTRLAVVVALICATTTYAQGDANRFSAVRLGELREATTGNEHYEHLRIIHLGEPTLLHAVPRADGTGYRTVIGKFLSPSSGIGEHLQNAAVEFDARTLMTAVSGVIDAFAPLLGVTVPFDPARLEVSTATIVEGTVVIELMQLRNGIPLEDAGLVVVFDRDGDLQSISGQLEDGDAVATENATGSGNAEIFPNPQSVAIYAVSGAIASSLKNTPNDTTYADIISFMSARFVAQHGSARATLAMAVIQHHGW